ncbi:MAG TPA: cobaltochelatase subunit CobN [Bauldia sp.]|nr:cobaltochelatase subunit CobN [Bauldia sp.]
MHLLAGEAARIHDGDAAVDLDQPPGDIVIFSAADTELAALAAVARPGARFANLARLTHPMSVDLYLDKTVATARLVVVRMMGGEGYWPYGLDRLRALSRAGGPKLAVMPGEDRWDAGLEPFATVSVEQCRQLWRYLVEGGAENSRRAMAYCDHLVGEASLPEPPVVLPHAGFYWPGEGVVTLDQWHARRAGRPAAPIVFYRALIHGGSTAPIDALAESLAERGLAALPVFVASLKDRESEALLADTFAAVPPAIVLNTTSFAVSRIGDTHGGTVLDRPGRPVLQVVLAGSTEEMWRDSPRGLLPRDLTMNVALPEVDGRILTRAVSFKADMSPGAAYRAASDRVAFVADQAAAWVRLAATPAAERKIALVLSNYPDRDGRIGNGVGLDTPASVVAVANAMQAAGYFLPGFPETSRSLMDLILAGPTNASIGRAKRETLSLTEYATFFATLPARSREAVTERWGAPDADPFVRNGEFRIAAHRFGNVIVGIQPARGYSIDPKATYHDPDLVPPHGYLAFYAWLRRAVDVDAMVHLGKHGNLEWLPGKALGLSATCWPEIALGATPVIYPFLVNDPGEGSQAKRRSSAVVVDHLMPPMTRAEIHGPLAELETLIDEYYLAAADKRRREYLASEIVSRAERHGLERDLGIARDNPDLLRALDAHLCELKEMQIRDGLHIFGQSPQGRQRVDTLAAIARTPRSGGRPQDASLQRAIAADLGMDFDPLDCDLAKHGDGVAAIEARTVAHLTGGQGVAGPITKAVLDWVDIALAPALDASGHNEIASVLTALDGRFVAPGPSGAPTRGRPDVLPTGRNFYSVDVRAVPTAAAWALGRKAADAVALRYFQDEGEWPRSIALSAWGTSNMRTGGDDIAQVLAFIGAAPTWEATTGRVTGFRVMSEAELGRPRIDVTLKISGMFRDAFPVQIDLIDSAMRAVGFEGARIFGAKPTAYGSGLQALMDTGAWETRADITDAVLAWGGFAYGNGAHGARAAEEFVARLKATDAVLHNQDNREHDILDSDDYYQFQGGLAAAVETLRGVAPRLYHGDHARPEKPVIRALGEEIARVVRGRAANPKWIAGVMRHGYKGAFEMAATVDYLFAFAATTDAVQNHHFDQLFDAYIGDGVVRDFIAQNNAPALSEMAARFREAIDRGLWAPRQNSAYDQLSALIAERKEAAE